MGKQWKQCQTLFSWAPKSLQMVTAAMKLKDAPAFIVCRRLNSGHSDWREMVPHCGFDLHFSLEKADAGRDWGQKEKEKTEDEMAVWHHRLDGREFE